MSWWGQVIDHNRFLRRQPVFCGSLGSQPDPNVVRPSSGNPTPSSSSRFPFYPVLLLWACRTVPLDVRPGRDHRVSHLCRPLSRSGFGFRTSCDNLNESVGGVTSFCRSDRRRRSIGSLNRVTQFVSLWKSSPKSVMISGVGVSWLFGYLLVLVEGLRQEKQGVNRNSDLRCKFWIL